MATLKAQLPALVREVEHPALMEALVQATEQLLAEHGPEGVTTLRIAAKAGVSLTVLFQCFRNKDAIVAEALARRHQRQVKAQRARSVAAPTLHRKRVETPPPPPARRAPAPPPAASLFRSPPPPSAPQFRTPDTDTKAEAQPAPAIFRLPTAPQVPPPSAPVAQPKPAPGAPEARAPEPPKPEPPGETIEDAIAVVVHRLVSTFAELLPSMKGMAQADRDAINRVELRRMAKAFSATLEQHGIPDPGHLAHVMTLSCDKVLKDAIRNASESFTDGRLEQALCRLCVDFVAT